MLLGHTLPYSTYMGIGCLNRLETKTIWKFIDFIHSSIFSIKEILNIFLQLNFLKQDQTNTKDEKYSWYLLPLWYTTPLLLHICLISKTKYLSLLDLNLNLGWRIITNPQHLSLILVSLNHRGTEIVNLHANYVVRGFGQIRLRIQMWIWSQTIIKKILGFDSRDCIFVLYFCMLITWFKISNRP